jgi:hypothetical protein
MGMLVAANETKLTGAPPTTLDEEKQRTGGSG